MLGWRNTFMQSTSRWHWSSTFLGRLALSTTLQTNGTSLLKTFTLRDRARRASVSAPYDVGPVAAGAFVAYLRRGMQR